MFLKISDLKFLIWNEKKITLRDVDYSNLVLWKVDIADSEERRLEDANENNIKNFLGDKKLKPVKTCKSYFPIQPVHNNIHIIVTVPAADATGKCLPTVYLSNKKFEDL